MTTSKKREDIEAMSAMFGFQSKKGEEKHRQ
jgi:hypothetical protein